MILHDYHKLIERDSSSISGLWKSLQISLYMLAAIFGIVCAVFFHILISMFDMNCILNPKIIVFTPLPIAESDNLNKVHKYSHSIPIDYIKSQWVDMDGCFLPLYNPLLSIICGIIWTTFFLMCPRGGKSSSGLKKPHQIVIPAFTFAIIFAIISIIATKKLNHGMDSFSSKFMNESENFLPTNETKWHEISLEINKVFIYVEMCVLSSWLYTVCWICAFLLLMLRCISVVDFQILHITIEAVENPKQENKPLFEQIIEVDDEDTAKTPNNEDSVTQSLLSSESFTSASNSLVQLIRDGDKYVIVHKTGHGNEPSPFINRISQCLSETSFDDDDDEKIIVHAENNHQKPINFETLTVDAQDTIGI